MLGLLLMIGDLDSPIQATKMQLRRAGYETPSSLEHFGNLELKLRKPLVQKAGRLQST